MKRCARRTVLGELAGDWTSGIGLRTVTGARFRKVLNGMTLNGVSFNGSDLTGADFTGVDLNGVDLIDDFL